MRKFLLSSAACIAVISTASAADLRPITKAPPMQPAPLLFSWTGFYIGGNVGGKWITNGDGHVDGPFGDSFRFDGRNDSSVIGGGQIGYNWQVGQWVLGIEGDADAQDFNTTRTVVVPTAFFVPGDTFNFRSEWQASLRGRVGYAFDRVLLYATGGVAWTQAKVTANLVGGGAFTRDDVITGGTVGGGIEWAVWNQVSLGVEGRFTFYGDQDFNGVIGTSAINHRINLDTAEVMGKINFRFW